MDNETLLVWTIGEEATFGPPRQAESSNLSANLPHAAYGKARGTASSGFTANVDGGLGMGVDIAAESRQEPLFRCGPRLPELPVNLDRDGVPSGQTVDRKA